MNEPYEELSRRATKGDDSALRELFTLAEQREGEKDFQGAIVAFRDAAIAYRISAFRNLARANDAESSEAWSSAVRDLYKWWIDANPSGLRELPYSAPNITYDCIRSVVVDQLLGEEFFIPIFVFLEDSLTEMGMQFYSPGGSIQRRACQLVGEVFGLGYGEKSEYLSDQSVRIALDFIVDEVAKRCQGAQVETNAVQPHTS